MFQVRRSALQLEPLNDRVVPAVVVEQVGGILYVTGDQRTNDIEITDDGTATGVDVVGAVNEDGSDFTATEPVTQVVVNARAGHDEVTYRTTGNFVGTDREVEVLLGNGHDTFTAELGHALDVDSSFTLKVLGGNGKDTLTVDSTGAVDGDLHVWLEGQNGVDAVGFTGTGAVSGELDVVLEGGNGKDDVTFDYTGELTGSLKVAADGGNGMDNVDVNVAATETSTGTVWAEVLGWNGKDTLNVSVEGVGLTVDATVDGGRGWDSVTHTDNVENVDPTTR